MLVSSKMRVVKCILFVLSVGSKKWWPITKWKIYLCLWSNQRAANNQQLLTMTDNPYLSPPCLHASRKRRTINA